MTVYDPFLIRRTPEPAKLPLKIDAIALTLSHLASRPSRQARSGPLSGIRAVTVVPPPTPRAHLDLATGYRYAVVDVHEAGTGVRALHVEAGAVVADRERQPAVVPDHADGRAGRALRVLGHVLQGLPAAEVDRALDLARIAPAAIHQHSRGHGTANSHRVERLAQAVRRQQRRVDAAREPADLVQRPIDLVAELSLERRGTGLVGRPELRS